MHENNSDDDQGFVPTKVQIKSDNKIRQKNKYDPRYDRPLDFQSRYIYGDGIIRKQPIQVYTRFCKYLREQYVTQNRQNNNADNKDNKNNQCMNSSINNDNNIDNKIIKQQSKQYDENRQGKQGRQNKLIKHQKHNQSNLIHNTKYDTHQYNEYSDQGQGQDDDIRKSMPSNLSTARQNISNINTNTNIKNNTNKKISNLSNTPTPIPSNPTSNNHNSSSTPTPTPLSTPIQQILKNQPSGHPYIKYIKNQNYILIYSRFKDRIQNITIQSDDFTYNQVNLTKVLAKYDGDCYSVLKGYEYYGMFQVERRKKTQGIDGRDGKDGKGVNGNGHGFGKQSIQGQVHGQINQHYNTLTFPQSQNNNNKQQSHQRLHSHSNQPSHQPSHQPHPHPSHQQNFHINSPKNSTSRTNNHNHSLSSHKNNNNQSISLSTNNNNNNPNNNNNDLQFDSRFQCGNLMFTFKHKLIQNYYTLFLQNDTNSYGYNQWFYFSLKNIKSKINYKFNIVNLRKRHSLFKQGMKISIFSLIDAQNNNGNGWKKCGNNIKYQRSGVKKSKDKKYKFYSLYFQLEFQHDNDYIQVAMNIPYSYSRLIHHLKICQNIVNQNKIDKQQKQKEKYKLQSPYRSRRRQMMKSLENFKDQKKQELIWETNIVGYSIANNSVPYLTIGIKDLKQIQRQKQIQKEKQKQIQKSSRKPTQTALQQQNPPPNKKVIIIMARQHPGQTWSSFMMQQILYKIAQNKSQHIKWLLTNYTFKIFPMINVDGVIYGNFRCDLGGFDTNRNWRNPDKNLHPQVYSIKTQIQKIASQNIIQCVLDLHGHSKQYNTFSYACKNDNISSRILSLLISQLNPVFHFPYCTFGLSKYKQTTARAAIYRLTGNQNILTIQNSFYGAKVGDKMIVYDPQVLGDLSESILEGLYHFLSKSQLRIKAQEKIKKNLTQYLSYQKQNTQVVAADSGSDSDPFLDEISIKDKIKKILPKSFKSMQQQLQEQQNNMKKKPAIVKKLPSQKKANKLNLNYKTLNPSPNKKMKSKEVEEQQQSPIKNPAFIQRTSLSHYKRNSKQLQRKQINQIDTNNSQESQRNQSFNSIQDVAIRTGIIGRLGDVSLPFYIRQKPTLVPIKLKNDSLEIFKDAYDATGIKSAEQQQQEISFRRTMAKASNKKVKILNVTHQQKKEQFPILCVLSQQKKRQSQMQKTHAFYHDRLQEKLAATSMPHKAKPFVQNEKLEYIKKTGKAKNVNSSHQEQIQQQEKEVQQQKLKIKQKNKDNATLISKIWRQNFARYGKDLNVFFGGMKG